MSQTARRAAALEISDPLRKALVRIRQQRGIVAAPEIDLQTVRDAERVLGGSIPTELLAFCAATKTSPDQLLGYTRSIARFYDASGQRDWRTRTRFHHVAFDDSYSDEGLLCTPMDGSGQIVEFWLRKGQTAEPDFLDEGEEPFVSYCRWKFSAPNTDAPVDFSSAVEKAQLTAFRPRVVAASKVKHIDGRRVRHATFGEGTVIREIPPDKLEIDFGEKGVKKLLAGIVELLA